MRLKTHRRGSNQNFHNIEQRGEGIREVKDWILNKGKRGLVYAKTHAADIAKLAAVAIKLYNGDTSNLIEAIKTSTEIFGMDELQALKNVIQDKKEEKKIIVTPPKAPPRAPPVNKTFGSKEFIKPTPRAQIRTGVSQPRKSPNNQFLSEIQSGKKLRTRAAETRITPQSGSLSSMLDAIKARRSMINPDDEQSGVGAKKILLKMAKHHMKNHASADRTLPATKTHIVGIKGNSVKCARRYINRFRCY
jgi:hypothetical protein